MNEGSTLCVCNGHTRVHMYLLYVLESNHAELLYYMLMMKQVTSTTLVVFCLAHPAKFLVSLGDFISEYSQFVNHLTTIYDYIYTHILNICLYIYIYAHESHISFNILSKHVTISLLIHNYKCSLTSAERQQVCARPRKCNRHESYWPLLELVFSKRMVC